MGLEFLEQDVGGHLEDAVGHEEDDQSRVVLVASAEIQITSEAK